MNLTCYYCLSLISLARLCGVFDINPREDESITQLTVLMYLSVQSKLRWRHTMTSLIDTLRVIQRHISNKSVHQPGHYDIRLS